MAASAAPPGPSFETVGNSRPPQEVEVSVEPVKTTVPLYQPPNAGFRFARLSHNTNPSWRRPELRAQLVTFNFLKSIDLAGRVKLRVPGCAHALTAVFLNGPLTRAA
jgi:hypothetical protein